MRLDFCLEMAGGGCEIIKKTGMGWDGMGWIALMSGGVHAAFFMFFSLMSFFELESGFEKNLKS